MAKFTFLILVLASASCGNSDDNGDAGGSGSNSNCSGISEQELQGTLFSSSYSVTDAIAKKSGEYHAIFMSSEELNCNTGAVGTFINFSVKLEAGCYDFINGENKIFYNQAASGSQNTLTKAIVSIDSIGTEFVTGKLEMEGNEGNASGAFSAKICD